ncbi:hypothetical protein [Granulicella arctica]|uniref:Uncharacterized protein n=1 Tax=Granulicella arctica TaxID=940613 RepID=A0A7Y9TGJ9_9BACT|nr:hypothetical protein [Granulicella arctica]NYF79569.1 hypothetical protein [Granulicella arctica]
MVLSSLSRAAGVWQTILAVPGLLAAGAWLLCQCSGCAMASAPAKPGEFRQQRIELAIRRHWEDDRHGRGGQLSAAIPDLLSGRCFGQSQPSR